jgi:hypothetical protein
LRNKPVCYDAPFIFCAVAGRDVGTGNTVVALARKESFPPHWRKSGRKLRPNEGKEMGGVPAIVVVVVVVYKRRTYMRADVKASDRFLIQIYYTIESTAKIVELFIR